MLESVGDERGDWEDGREDENVEGEEQEEDEAMEIVVVDAEEGRELLGGPSGGRRQEGSGVRVV